MPGFKGCLTGPMQPVGSRKSEVAIRSISATPFESHVHHHLILPPFTQTPSGMSTENTSDFENLREKFGRFRILIVGRANAGKTTILQRICNTTETPEIYDGKGNKVLIQVNVL